jgi:hypothetical protein
MKTLFILFLLPLELLSQDLTGVWVGNIHTGGNALPFELVISKNKDQLSGYSLMIFTIKDNENLGVKTIRVKDKNGSIFLEDDELVYNNYTTPPKKVRLFGELTLEIKNSVFILHGRFQTKSADFRSTGNNAYSGTIELVKQDPLDKTRLIRILDQLNLLSTLSFLQQGAPEKKDLAREGREQTETEPPLPKQKDFDLLASIRKQPPPLTTPGIMHPKKKTFSFPQGNMDELIAESIIIAAKERKTAILRTVYFKSDSLVLRLYDNGVVDGDSVSVVLNGRVIIARQGLTTKAIRVIVHVTPELGDSLLFTMVAENLGTIPPNTGLLIVDDGDDRNEIRFEGDMQMSSAVLFRKKH